MLSFDPDKYAVVGERPMTRMGLQNKRWSSYGLVREVWLQETDLPYLMICFSCRDIGRALQDTRPDKFMHRLTNWGWQHPRYRSKQAWMQAGAKGMSWKDVRVYTYPEAAVILDACEGAIVTNFKEFGKRKNPEMADRVNKALDDIRQELEALYD